MVNQLIIGGLHNMPRLVPNDCREERITLGTYERTLLKEYIQFQKDKEFNSNLTQVTSTAITGVATVAASIPLIIGAWIAKESIGDFDISNFGNKILNLDGDGYDWFLITPRWWEENFWSKFT
jgi:hypothetical protein